MLLLVVRLTIAGFKTNQSSEPLQNHSVFSDCPVCTSFVSARLGVAGFETIIAIEYFSKSLSSCTRSCNTFFISHSNIAGSETIAAHPV